MKTRLVRMGNSRGVRLPKLLIDQAGLTDEVEISFEDGVIVIKPTATPRAGWSEAAREMQARHEDILLDAPVPTAFDAQDWEW